MSGPNKGVAWTPGTAPAEPDKNALAEAWQPTRVNPRSADDGWQPDHHHRPIVMHKSAQLQKNQGGPGQDGHHLLQHPE